MAGRLTVRRRRAQRTRAFRLKKTPWIDPYPAVPGTEPEKRIFAELMRRRIFFIFQGQIPELQRGLYVTLSIPGYKPDFILPEYKVIIDPFSEFHHSLPDAIERDIRKIALYTAFGYAYYYPWAEEVNKDASGVVGGIKELHRPKVRKLTPRQRKLAQNPGYELGPFLGAGANSVAAANRARTKPKSKSLTVGTRRSKRRGRTL